MKKNVKSFLITIIILIIVAAGIIMWFGISKGNSKQTLAYSFTSVTKKDISNSVTATGTVEPIKQVEVGTQVSGIIDKIYVDYNSQVKEGELIAELDRSVLETELKASQANLQSAKAEYEYQQTNYKRMKELFEKDMVSASDYETTQYQYLKAEAAYSQAKANIQKSERNISYSKIYSPIDGVVMSREVDEGQTVASGFSTPTLFKIAQDLKKMQVIADVDEADIGEVKEGQSVTFEVDAFPEEIFQGNVTQVRLNATTTSNVVTYEVVIDAPNPDLKLKPGLTANVSILTKNEKSVLTVPVRALRFTPSEYQGVKPEKCVWSVSQDGKVYPIEIKTGISDGVNTQIISGLSEGDRVISGIEINIAGAIPKADSGAQGGGNSNPFMPKRPSEKDNVRTK
jgi:HlyD family secretion protein